MAGYSRSTGTSVFKMRLSRKAYWWSILGMLAANAALVFLLPDFGGSSFLAVWLMLYGWRLHDIGRSAWWGVLATVLLSAFGVLAAVLALDGFVYLFRGTGGMSKPPTQELLIAGLLGGGALLASLAFTVWLGLQRGDPDENRYGPPLGQRPARRDQTIFAQEPADPDGTP